MNDRLIELLHKAEDICDSTLDCDTCKYVVSGSCKTVLIADYLLANGVIVPPCKVGDKVYALFNGKVLKASVFSMKIETEDNKYVFMPKLKIFDHLLQFKTFLFGRTAFLTKEEAEEKLKELKGNGNR